MGKKQNKRPTVKKGKKAKRQRQYEPQQDYPTSSILKHDDDIEKAWWMTCWLDKNLRLYRAPIASRLTTIAGSHESTSNILVLSSAYDLPLRIGESLDYLAMKAFASESMMSASGRNNELPYAVGNELMEIHSDCSAKTSILGVSAVFSVRDCSYSYAGGMIVDSNLLIFNYGEFIAATSAMLIAVSHGYRDIVISTDCESLVKVWNDEDVGTLTENVDRQLLALKGILQSQGYSIRIQHVKGHSIDFRNTMADGLAEMGYSRPVGTDSDLMVFDYSELRDAYSETISLNERLKARVAELETQASAQTGAPQQTEPAPSPHSAHKQETTPPIVPESSAEPAGMQSDAINTEQDGSALQEQSPNDEGTPSANPSPARHDGSSHGRQRASEHSPRRRSRQQPSSQPRPHSLSINQATVEVCRLLNEAYDNVNVNRVDRLVAGGAIEKWENLSDNQANLQYARNLVSAQSVHPDNQRIDAIWNALAKNVARKVTNKYSAQKKRSPLVMRTMLVARLCGVPIEPSVDYVLSHQPGQQGQQR